MPADKSDILHGTLDFIVLKTLHAMGPLHGYAIARSQPHCAWRWKVRRRLSKVKDALTGAEARQADAWLAARAQSSNRVRHQRPTFQELRSQNP